MNTRYCLCGYKNEYTITKPTTCSSCGCNMDKAFASAAIVVSTPVVAATPTRHLSRPTPVIAPPRRRRPIVNAEGEDDTPEDYDQNEMEILASEMAQEVEGLNLFSIGVEDEYRPLKLGSLSNVREAATKRSQEPAGPKRRARK